LVCTGPWQERAGHPQFRLLGSLRGALQPCCSRRLEYLRTRFSIRITIENHCSIELQQIFENEIQLWYISQPVNPAWRKNAKILDGGKSTNLAIEEVIFMIEKYYDPETTLQNKISR
jgi:hypothetical protein